MTNPIPVYKNQLSKEIIANIELEHFTCLFQNSFEDGNIDRVYLDSAGKIVCLESDGDITENII